MAATVTNSATHATGVGRPRSPVPAPAAAFVVGLCVATLILTAVCGQPPNAFEAADVDQTEEAAADELADPGVFLPGDRNRERQLDRARRLIADERWSDAAVAFDELLAIERDAFVLSGTGTTRDSIRSAAAAAVAALPRPGRDAYRLLFDARAAKQLAAAIAADDRAAIVAVARRWLHTPAGRQAAVLAAVTLLESGQPLAAAAWLDRLAALQAPDEIEPAVRVMRAVARHQAGDQQAGERLVLAGGRSDVRLAGRDVTIPPGAAERSLWLADLAGGRDRPRRLGSDWRQLGGGPARSGVVTASRPLLVPRYRVPLVRHPEEARQLEKTRQAAADAGEPLQPAGVPLAVGERVVVQTPLGILAIDFESGRRIWLESAVNVAEVESPRAGGELGEQAGAAATDQAFADATSGNLASDGQLVFAVESTPEALAARQVTVAGFGRGLTTRDDEVAAINTLSAYSLTDGALRWRLPARDQPRPAAAANDDDSDDAAPAGRWHMGPPLVVGDDLFVLLEERGEVRVEARATTDGTLRWSQPLATYDEGDTIATRDARPRRLAGLTAAYDEGVLVCPIGGGCTVAVDVATRSLLWAHAYERPNARGEALGRALPPEADRANGGRGGEPAPIIAGGRVLLAPFDANLLICLSLRDGQPIWQQRRDSGTRIVGIVDTRVLTVGDKVVEALDIATGRSLWNRELGEGVRPSGRSLLTPQAVLVPCDAPAVVEIALADGRVVGRSAGRGSRIPGNLVAYRGEVISRSIDSLEVFHQQAALEQRIETARRDSPDNTWAVYWRGQAALAAGDIATGLDGLARAAAVPGFRIPPGDLDEAIVAAMRQDFPAAVRGWEAFPDHGPSRSTPAVGRMAVDGFLAAGDAAAAWESLEPLLAAPPALEADAPPALVSDPADPGLAIGFDRWIQGRLGRLMATADEPLRGRIDARCTALVKDAIDASGASDSAGRRRRIEAVCERLGRHPAAEAAWHALQQQARTNGGRQAAVRVAFSQLAEFGSLPPADERGSDTERTGDAHAWPLGKVDVRRARSRHERISANTAQRLPLTLTGGGAAGTRAVQAVIDTTRERLLLNDQFGRAVTDPLPVEGLGGGLGLPFFNQIVPLELAVLERGLFVRTTTGIVAYDLEADAGSGRGLWRRADLGTEADDRVRWGGGGAGRITRDGGVPLGLRIVEPDDGARGGGRGMMALPTGLVVPGSRSIAVLDPATGRMLWERHRLPRGLEWFFDNEFLCGCTADGRGSVICQATDGRLLHTTDVPHRRQRIAAQGRRFVAVRPLDEHAAGPIADRVLLELVDPVDRETRPLGEFAGNARAVATGDGRLAVLEPGGRLAVFDLADGAVVFRTLLAEPRPVERLHVQAWNDRYLVFAGATDEGPDGEVAPLEQFLLSGGATAPLSGSVWAVDRATGRSLWPVPAVVERHCLHTAEPPGLPILTFCRLLQRRGGGQASLSVLCLDKRTGHAVFESDRIDPQTPLSFGCDIVGDPGRATIMLGDDRPLELVFTGLPMAPRPPFRSRGRLPLLAEGEMPD